MKRVVASVAQLASIENAHSLYFSCSSFSLSYHVHISLVPSKSGVDNADTYSEA